MGTTGVSDDRQVRSAYQVRGRVQGVGFRPFVYRLATELGLSGHVGNDSHGAFIEVQGPAEAVERFEQRLRAELPPLADITELSVRHLPLRADDRFVIQTSAVGHKQDAEITPDAATCPDCLAELFDPSDRRYRYPFINCTNCGPRYSIIRGVPYDRPNTTMAAFIMCPQCQAEYDDPADRRFHAQPNACPVCGPRLWLADASGQPMDGDAIARCAELLRAGRIVAMKGIGGFHLACDAAQDEAVRMLRARKGREAKPLAMMVGSVEAARGIAEIGGAAEQVLASVERPIVLAPKRPGARISDQVAPETDSFGVMLPYTPVHHLLFAEGMGPLVMTSANPTEEPLCCDNAEALQRLAGIADAFLLHDREIERRVDDSVVTVPDGQAAWPMPIRRARGFAPAAITVPVEAAEPVLATGGELKSTVCLLSGRDAVLSEHLGELSNARALRNFMSTVDQFKRLLRVEPKRVACDLHPEYAAARYARGLGLPVTAVQHHHAHIVSCMAEAGLSGPVIGVACDGTGYGVDGAIWGCEVLACDEAGFERVGQLEYFPLLGGDAAARETWRPAAGLLWQAVGEEWRAASGAFGRVSDEALAIAGKRFCGGRLPQTSSLGRLFDAAAFLLGVCDRNRYEGQAAMMLEAVARGCCGAEPLAVEIHDQPDTPLQWNPAGMLVEMVELRREGVAVAMLARAFHETVAAALGRMALWAGERTGRTRVVLSGGCFANRLLLERLTERLTAGGREVFAHRRVPTGDGGIALGQAVVAAVQMRTVENVCDRVPPVENRCPSGRSET